MSPIPRDGSLDSTLALLSEGYTFVMNRCRRYGSDAFETRLMLRPVVCAMGEDAARMFYEPGRFTRKGSMPTTTLLSLQDRGSVQTLDGEAHRVRKRLFLELMTPDALERLCALAAEEWTAAARRWQGSDRVVLLAELRAILCRAACRWVGVPLDGEEAVRRTEEFAAMIDGAGAVGPRNWRGLLLRRRSERWLRAVVEAVRAGARAAPEGSPLQAVVRHRDADGAPLDTDVAVVELLNLLRPIVAVSQFMVFAALALHEHPESRAALEHGGDEELERFVQEVRRFYPFFPVIGGRVRQPFDWRGRHFAEGAWVLLDLYGTNHDVRIWEDPGAFRPERFRGREIGAFALVPQGGGGFEAGHRCPGEWITIAVMKTLVGLLVGGIRYTVPAQDLSVDLARMPAVPASGFVIAAVQATPASS
ncbi:cytochrome P450 [Azospirillum sp. ST 5-10]|uniref:cytochrome P450 n=1 Tax=unclassified Azospirillum TaxID=2630922 RepID=UPI003F4A7CB9